VHFNQNFKFSNAQNVNNGKYFEILKMQPNTGLVDKHTNAPIPSLQQQTTINSNAPQKTIQINQQRL